VATDADRVLATLQAGGPVLLPTDTVYGLCASPFAEEPVRRLYRLKGREDTRPTALLAAGVETLLELLPELEGRAATIVRVLLPDGFTLVLPNPAERFPWLTGGAPTIGVRVPVLPESTRSVVEALGAVAATSANDPGGPDPSTLKDVPARIRAGCAELDAGRLPGTASTVLDFSGQEPVVLREGAASSVSALARVHDALSS
jgi:L-threonylcarbamoyladenylate synthase